MTVTDPWQENERGPDCYCGNPMVVKIMWGKPVLLCFFHTVAEGVYEVLPAERPADWHDRLKDNSDD